MLNRAATNAYSWWWASHIRTKQSKWLEQNLKDMEEKINFMLKVIEQDGDSFAKRAEMYYKKRPELINSVEESYKAYRSLAERFDHLSKDFQAANRTIATVFPEHVQLSIDSEDYDGLVASSFAHDRDGVSTTTPPKNMPKAPNLPKQNNRAQTLMANKREQIEKSLARESLPSSLGLSKEEALREIDTFQKDILSMQTEKEFVKNTYETALAKFTELENRISDSQSRVCALEDEFGLGTIMEEHEARSLMAESALKSCVESLDKLKDDQLNSRNKVDEECRRIIEAHERLDNLKKAYRKNNEYEEQLIVQSKDFEVFGHNEQEGESLGEQLQVSSSMTFTESDMAQKIDDLVQKISNLEMALCSQNALVKRLRVEIDVLLRHMKSLEEEKESFVEGFTMKNRIKELEEELKSVKSLNEEILEKNNNINVDINEAGCKLDHLHQKLPELKPDEGNNLLFSSNEKKSNQETTSQIDEMEDENDDTIFSSSKATKDEDRDEEDEKQEMVESPCEIDKQEVFKMVESPREIDKHLDIEDGLNWRKLHSNNMEDREKNLVEEYSTFLRDYKDLKIKLNKLKDEHRCDIDDLTSQLRELKNIIAAKDEEIQMLLKKLNALQTCDCNKTNSGVQELKNMEKEQNESKEEDVLAYDDCDLDRKPLFHHLYDRNDVIDEQPKVNNEEEQSSTDGSKEKRVKINLVVKSKPVSKIESRFRAELDDLLESNMDFWLRFSTSFHQIQKFQSSIKDLQLELTKLKETQKKEGPDRLQQSKSDARPIYKHLREIETELMLWLEHNSVFQEELRSRFSSLNNIQEEITKISGAKDGKEKELHKYQEAKFQGEILNMKQENNKVAGELQAGVQRVKSLKVEIGKALVKMEREYGFADLKSRSFSFKSSSKSKTPFHSFLFGMKLKKHKKTLT